MRIEKDVKLDYCDVLFRPKRSDLASRSQVTLTRNYKFRNSEQSYSGVPIIAANMDGVGTFEMAQALNDLDCFVTLKKSYTSEQIHAWHSKQRLKNFAVSTGITDADLERLDQTMRLNRSIKYICIDVANGYSEQFLDTVARLRDKYPGVTLIAGNVVTPEVTEELILKGADIVKVGIGPGSVCTTRIKTGVGYPQLSAVIECADAAHGLGGHIIADGGCTCPGDVAKAFGAGADFVMLGGMLAGTDQGGGDITSKMFTKPYTLQDGKPIVEWKQYVEFYGMSSKVAQEKHGGHKEYRASEGRVVNLPYRGDVQPIIGDILGGVRSTCTYVGASTLKELSKRTTFIQVNNGRQYNSSVESHTTGE